MTGSLRVAPRPRKQAPSPAYPVLLGAAMALSACASQPKVASRTWTDPGPVATERSDSRPVLVMATDPRPQYRYPPPPPPGPPPEALMELIEDPAAYSQNVACAGDCPASYRTGGPGADIRFRVESGDVPDARLVLSNVQGTLHACAAQRGSRAGWIQIRASVRADGGLQPIEVRSDGGQTSEQVSCVANAVLATRFGRRWNAATILVVVEVTSG